MKAVPPNLPDTTPDIANLTPEEISANEQAKVLPWFVGTRKIAVTWISPVYNLHSAKITGPPSELGQFFHKYRWDPKLIQSETIGEKLGSNSGAEVTAWFASIGGVVCAGPVDELVALLVNGKTIWPASHEWADGIIEVPTIRRQRAANKARLEFGSHHGLKKGKKVIISGLSDGSFNEASPTTLTDASGYRITYNNTGSNVDWTADSGGRVTKIVDYEFGDYVRDGAGIFRCIFAHTSTPDKRPPNPTYWEPTSILRGSSFNPYYFTIDQFGEGFFYWGTDDQELDATTEKVLVQNSHPPYRRQAVLVLKNFLIGAQKQAFPNIEVIVRRAPQQVVIDGDAAGIDSAWQANPAGAIAELITNPVFGLGQSASLIDSSSWQALADDLEESADLTYISAFMDQAASLRATAAKLLEYYDGWLRWSNAGKLEAGRFLHDQAAPTFTADTTIDYHDVIEEIAWQADGWAATYGEAVVKFEDQLRAFKQAAMRAISLYNRAVVGEPRPAVLDRQWITRQQQALDHAAEWLKINAQPALSGELTVRTEKAASIRQGDLFRLTHDAVSLSLACRCLQKTFAAPPAGRVTIAFALERGLAPIPYTATPRDPGGTILPAPEVVTLYQFLQPPPALVDSTEWPIIVLIARTTDAMEGVAIWLRIAEAESLYLLGEQGTFAVSGRLSAVPGTNAPRRVTRRVRISGGGITSDTIYIYFDVTGFDFASSVELFGFSDDSFNYGTLTEPPRSLDFNFATGALIFSIGAADPLGNRPDADETENDGWVVNLTAGGANAELLEVELDELTVQADLDKISETQTEDAIENDSMLVFIVKADDPSTFEIATLATIILDSGTYNLTVRRGRFGTVLQEWEEGDKIWIIARADLRRYGHSSFEALIAQGGTGVFKLQGRALGQSADLTDPDECPDIEFQFEDIYAPRVEWTLVILVGSGEVTDFSGPFLDTDQFDFSIRLTDANSNLTSAQLVGRLGTLEMVFWSRTFSPSGYQLATAVVNFPRQGTWRLFCIAQDADGRTTETEFMAPGTDDITTIRIANDPVTHVGPPVATPAGGTYPYYGFNVTLTCPTAGATIKYEITSYGAAPSGSWTTYSAPIPIDARLPATIYSYALKGGMTDSDIVRDDYQHSFLPPR